MAGNISLEIVTPEKAVVSEDAKIVMAPGTLGEFGVLSGHTPFLTTLKTGSVKYIDAKGKERFVFVSGGFAEALPDKVTILAESAERRRDIDLTAPALPETCRRTAAVQRPEYRLRACQGGAAAGHQSSPAPGERLIGLAVV